MNINNPTILKNCIHSVMTGSALELTTENLIPYAQVAAKLIFEEPLKQITQFISNGHYDKHLKPQPSQEKAEQEREGDLQDFTAYKMGVAPEDYYMPELFKDEMQ